MVTTITIQLNGILTADAIREMAEECEDVFDEHLILFAVEVDLNEE